MQHLLIALSLAASGPNDSSLLLADPLAGRPTEHSITLTAVAGERPVTLALQLEEERSEGPAASREMVFGEVSPVNSVASGRRVTCRIREGEAGSSAHSSLSLEALQYVEMDLEGLKEGCVYRWSLRVSESAPGAKVGLAIPSQEHRGRFVTVRPRGSSFQFALFSDSHFFVKALTPPVPQQALRSPDLLQYVVSGVEWYRSARARVEAEFLTVAASINDEHPDFVVGLGDHFDLHGLDFNASLPNQELADAAHLEARRSFARLSEAGSLYQVVGNWEGESGCHPEEGRGFARAARLKYTVNPRADRGAILAAPDEDYYAFRWGDLLVVVLNVRGYTPSRHELGGNIKEGGAEDFTLGPAQLEFLERVLREQDLPYKILCIHHAVGGNAGDADNSNYGRGGGRAAHVGEQARVHELMLRSGVQVFFYGHDHVFTDMVVDGIHYTLPGTTGAPWRFGPEVTGYEKFWTVAGHGRVSVTPERMRVELVDIDRNVLHAYEVPPKAPSGR